MSAQVVDRGENDYVGSCVGRTRGHYRVAARYGRECPGLDRKHVRMRRQSRGSGPTFSGPQRFLLTQILQEHGTGQVPASTRT